MPFGKIDFDDENLAVNFNQLIKMARCIITNLLILTVVFENSKAAATSAI